MADPKFVHRAGSPGQFIYRAGSPGQFIYRAGAPPAFGCTGNTIVYTVPRSPGCNDQGSGEYCWTGPTTMKLRFDTLVLAPGAMSEPYGSEVADFVTTSNAGFLLFQNAKGDPGYGEVNHFGWNCRSKILRVDGSYAYFWSVAIGMNSGGCNVGLSPLEFFLNDIVVRRVAVGSYQVGDFAPCEGGEVVASMWGEGCTSPVHHTAPANGCTITTLPWNFSQYSCNLNSTYFTTTSLVATQADFSDGQIRPCDSSTFPATLTISGPGGCPGTFTATSMSGFGFLYWERFDFVDNGNGTTSEIQVSVGNNGCTGWTAYISVTTYDEEFNQIGSCTVSGSLSGSPTDPRGSYTNGIVVS